MSNKGKKAKPQYRATLNLRRLSEAEYRDLWHCINCDHCYPVKAIGEEAAEGWYCISHKRYVKPDDFCSFAELEKKYTEDEE